MGSIASLFLVFILIMKNWVFVSLILIFKIWFVYIFKQASFHTRDENMKYFKNYSVV